MMQESRRKHISGNTPVPSMSKGVPVAEERKKSIAQSISGVLAKGFSFLSEEKTNKFTRKNPLDFMEYLQTGIPEN